MDERLGSLARFERINSVRQVDHLVIDLAWTTVDDTLPLVAQYDVYYRPMIRFSPYAEADEVAPPRECVTLTGEEFLSVLVWLIRRGLLEDVGLVSRETAASVGAGARRGRRDEPARTGPDEDGPYQCGCTLVPARVGATHAALETALPVQEGEPDDDDPFDGEYDLVEGAGDPSWLELPTVMRYLHHDQELSATDMARVCDTTPARVRGTLKRHGIEYRSYRGGRSKIGPRRSGPASTGR